MKRFYRLFREYLDPVDGCTDATIWKALVYAWKTH